MHFVFTLIKKILTQTHVQTSSSSCFSFCVQKCNMFTHEAPMGQWQFQDVLVHRKPGCTCSNVAGWVDLSELASKQ